MDGLLKPTIHNNPNGLLPLPEESPSQQGLLHVERPQVAMSLVPKIVKQILTKGRPKPNPPEIPDGIPRQVPDEFLKKGMAKRTTGETVPVGKLQLPEMQELKRRGIDYSEETIRLLDRKVGHFLRPKTSKKDIIPSMDEVRNMLSHLSKAERVYFDHSGREPTLMYVFRSPDNSAGKIILNVKFGKKDPIVTPVNMQKLRDPDYFLKNLDKSNSHRLIRVLKE